MEDIDGRLHPALDGQSLDEDEDGVVVLLCFFDVSMASEKSRNWYLYLNDSVVSTDARRNMYKQILQFPFEKIVLGKLDGSLNKKVRFRERVPKRSSLSPKLFLE